MADLAALLAERARIQAQADADLKRVGRDIVAAQPSRCAAASERSRVEHATAMRSPGEIMP